MSITTPRIYADDNATAPLRPCAQTAMVEAFALAGNPASIHAEGRAARALMEGARKTLTDLLGASPRNLIFTASGTEAAHLALSPKIFAKDTTQAKLLLNPSEHVCVLEGHNFAPEAVLPLTLDNDGRVDLVALRGLTASLNGQPFLCAVQAANNETGVLQDVADIARKIHAAGGFVVCDGAQAFGRIPFDFATTNADILLLSAHKIGGPKGVGAVAWRDGLEQAGVDLLRARFFRGGGQEFGYRAGTENVAAIAGFAAVANEAAAQLGAEAVRLKTLRDGLQEALLQQIPNLVVFGAGAPRLPNTLLFAVPHVSAQTALMALDLAGLAASSGAACSSGKVSTSHVLTAMDVAPDLAKGAIRLSFGWNTQAGDVAAVKEIVVKTFAKLQRR